MKLAIAAAMLAVCSLSAYAEEDSDAPATPAWIERSNANTRILLLAGAAFNPEDASSLGQADYDTQVLDLAPAREQRLRVALGRARDDLSARLENEHDELVRQDLQILVDSADQQIKGSELQDKYLLNWIDVPRFVFEGLRSLLEDQMPPERRAKAVDRLQLYAGLAPGSKPLTQLAKDRFADGLAKPGLLYPTKLELDRALTNTPTYIKGIREAFAQAKLLPNAAAGVKALEKQLNDYQAWTRKTVLPKARADFKLPPELYAFQLRTMGIDIEPQLLMQRAQLEYAETRAAMQALAPQIAKAKSESADGYRDVIRALKKKQMDREAIEPYYREVGKQIEAIIEREKIVDVPKRPMVMRLASEAESAASPAPHFLPAPMIGNTGQQGQFVLPLGNPQAGGGAGQKYDDFNFGAAAWTLSAHEGRPGHELQFTAMIERGVSLARSIFAFNSVNAEGWALYAEAEMLPYEPLEGQMIALQFRMLRAARAMLDPMLNLGLIDREAAGKVLRNEVMLSEAMARQELDRYTFGAPGQAGSYFYGYSRLLELRTETELRLGDKFDRKAFNNFLLDQGMMPPKLLAEAVRTRFDASAKSAEQP